MTDQGLTCSPSGTLCLKVRLSVVTMGAALLYNTTNMSRVMRKPDYCIFENKNADQLLGNHAVDQRICFFPL